MMIKTAADKLIRCSLWHPLALLLLLAMISIHAGAQTTDTDGTTPLRLTPGAPAGSYAVSGFENVNLFNGNLNFALPLAKVGGRGTAGYTMTLAIEQKWRVEQFTETPPNSNPILTPMGTWWNALTPGYGPGVLEGRRAGGGIYPEESYCGSISNASEVYERTLTRLTFTGADGTEFELRDQLKKGEPALVGQTPCTSQGYNRGTIFVTADGSAATFISDADILDYKWKMMGTNDQFRPSGYLMLRDGTRYRIDNGLVYWMRDRNGNLLSFTYGDYDRVTSVKDSLNRLVTITYDNPVANGSTYDLISYGGFGGQPRSIKVWRTGLGDVLRSGYSLRTPRDLFPELTGGSSYTNFTTGKVSKVELPDGERFYQFRYNPYGELERIELPTGGVIEYRWASGVGSINPSGSDGQSIYRRVTKRYTFLDQNASTPENVTTYSVPPDGTNPTNVVVETRDGNETLLGRSSHDFHGGPHLTPDPFDAAIKYPVWNHGREYRTDSFDIINGASVLKQRVEHSWQQREPLSWDTSAGAPANDPRLVETKTTLSDTNQVSKQTYLYDQYNNRTDVDEYDFGAGAAGVLLRRTHTDYLTTNPVNGADYASTTITTSSIHIRSLPTQQSVFEPNGATWIERARTTFEYDNYTPDTAHHTLIPRASISGLDPAFTTSYLTRGNVTQTASWLLQSNVAYSSYAQYDVAGNVVKTIDPRGYATTLDYTDCFGTPDAEARICSAPGPLAAYQSYALPTVVTNALGHAVRAQYDYYLGRVVDGEDANGIVSSGYYGDVLDRPTQVVRAANTAQMSQTSFLYNDAGRSVSSTSDQIGYGDNLLKSETLYDTLGRSTESRQYESQSVYITTRQSYDALGRVKQTSNPFRSGETVFWTTMQYDALGRATSATTPDGAVVSTSYSGNQVTVIDQAGKDRQSTTDALGRLIQVVEDPGAGGLNHATTYAYDVLSNLTTVTQGIQTRSFSYDSLKRLTSVINPEICNQQGAQCTPVPVTYQYDANGNLVQKTDARGVITTYGYDALNRATSRSYSDGTPSVTYTYDAAGIAYSKGKLTSVSSSVSATNYTGFDAMGRVTAHQQVTAGQSYQMGYGYNLTGALTTETYPSGRVVSTAYDVAGRISTVSGQKSGEAAKTYASQFSYASHGAVQNMTLGNSLTEQTAFNSRLQPLMIKLATNSNQSVEEMHYSYGGADNNGNVLHHTTVVDGVARQQVFEYDQLNRLKKGYEVNQANGVLHWQQEFIYDRYGNRNFDVAQTTPAMLGSNLMVNETNNRYTAGQGLILYDNAGNLTRDFNGHTFAYDGENKQTSYDGGAAADGADYRYDGDGRRVKKINGIGQATTIFVYDVNGQLVAEYSTSTPVGSGGTSYLTSDTLGTPRVITIASGAVKARHDYLPFGEEIAGVGGRTAGQGYVVDGVRQKFTQKERDVETGLDYFLARYYSSAQGRFTSPDEFTGGPDELFDFADDAAENPTFYSDLTNPQSLNKYQYTYNNPINLTDPDGHCPDCPSPAAPPVSGVTLALDILRDPGRALDLVQTAISLIGIVPGAELADVANAGISIKRGNAFEATIDGVGALGPVGSAVAVGNRARKILSKADDVADAVGDLKKVGRSGKQERLRQIAKDDKVSSADRGWIRQEMNQIKRGTRKSIRNPPGKDLAHQRGREAAKGFSYKHSNLQDRKLHKIQHKYDNYGRRNKKRP